MSEQTLLEESNVIEAPPVAAQQETALIHSQEISTQVEALFRPTSDVAQQQIELSVESLACQQLQQLNTRLTEKEQVPRQAVHLIDALVSEIDTLVERQMTQILHNQSFQNSERS